MFCLTLPPACQLWCMSLTDVQKRLILLTPTPVSMASLKIDPRLDMAILDPDVHPSFNLFKKGTRLMAYVSTGEAENYRSYWPKIAGRNWILKENKDWPGDYRVDLRSAEWQSIILDELIPEIVRKGFHGVFLDTLDTSEYLEELSPQYRGAKKAAIDFVRELHRRYPRLLILTNNTLSLLAELAPFVDGFVVESLLGMPDFEKGGYRPVPAEQTAEKIRMLREALRKKPVPVFVVDYASEEDRISCRKETQAIRGLGFKPYVAEKGLNRVYSPCDE